MSYEIVRNLRIKHNENGYYAVIKSASNNVRPLLFNEWTLGKDKGLTKEELEKILLQNFYNGNLQKGNSIYRKVIKEICKDKNIHLLKDYTDKSNLYNIERNKLWSFKGDRDSEEYINLSNNVNEKYFEMEEVLKNTLYNFMIENKTSLRQTKVKPFIIQDKFDKTYIVKLNKRTYNIGYEPVQFTSKKIYDRVVNSDWFTKNFNIIFF